ncbi:unnamed protein product [Prunus brigantina]
MMVHLFLGCCRRRVAKLKNSHKHGNWHGVGFIFTFTRLELEMEFASCNLRYLVCLYCIILAY